MKPTVSSTEFVPVEQVEEEAACMWHARAVEFETAVRVEEEEFEAAPSAEEEAWDKLEQDYANNLHKIHRIPASLRDFCGERGYIVPKMVAIGPYYHDLPELQRMEEVKKAAAYHFCRSSGQPRKAVYDKVLAVAEDAARCYDLSALKDKGISESAFVNMMFYDGCFLLHFMNAISNHNHCARSLRLRAGLTTSVVYTDIFLLENQIPWVVLQALGVDKEVNLCKFISLVGMFFPFYIDHIDARPLKLGNHRPPHLLGLFHFYQTDNKPRCPAVKYSLREEANSANLKKKKESLQPDDIEDLPVITSSFSLCTSSIELAEIGIKLNPSKTAELKDIGLTIGPFFRQLFLPSLHLNDITASWLLNMAAFEACTPPSFEFNVFVTNSYLAIFAMLMNREEDVHEMRAKHLIKGDFNDKQTLDFFKGRLSSCLILGPKFIVISHQLEKYKQKWALWVAIHRFVYNNIKTIAMVLSIVSVLVAIFKTLLSIKRR